MAKLIKFQKAQVLSYINAYNVYDIELSTTISQNHGSFRLEMCNLLYASD